MGFLPRHVAWRDRGADAGGYRLAAPDLAAGSRPLEAYLDAHGLGSGPIDEDLVADPLGVLGAGRVSRTAAKRAEGVPHKLREPLATLGLDWPVSLDAAKARWKLLAKQHHPDANNGDRGAEERFKSINLAYAALRAHLAPEPTAMAG